MGHSLILSCVAATVGAFMLTVAGCTEEPEATATATPESVVVVIEDLECIDAYPGIPGPVAHSLQVQGSVANPGGPPIRDAELEIVIEDATGTVSYTLERQGPPPNVLNIPTGSSVSFHSSKDLTTEDPSFGGGACRITLSIDGEAIPIAGGSEAVIGAVYYP